MIVSRTGDNTRISNAQASHHGKMTDLPTISPEHGGCTLSLQAAIVSGCHDAPGIAHIYNIPCRLTNTLQIKTVIRILLLSSSTLH